MERRAASHTEEEEMNQRRRLLNAAKKGDQKAVNKLFELYQVRIFSGEMVNKMNRAAGLHKLRPKGIPAKGAKGSIPKKAGLSKGVHKSTSSHPKSGHRTQSKRLHGHKKSKR
ncbi:MAG TPA: hypothetical protein VH681_10115 [Nitrospiraceae bacterium]